MYRERERERERERPLLNPFHIHVLCTDTHAHAYAPLRRLYNTLRHMQSYVTAWSAVIPHTPSYFRMAYGCM